jgi:transposase InsO family protein
MKIKEKPAQIHVDNGSTYVPHTMKQFFAYYKIKHVTGIIQTPQDKHLWKKPFLP